MNILRYSTFVVNYRPLNKIFYCDKSLRGIMDLLQEVLVSNTEDRPFCKGPFWNSTLTWHSLDPDIAACFRDTVLVGGPCAFLWIVGFPFWAWKIFRIQSISTSSQNRSTSSNRSRLKGKSFFTG